MDNYYREPVIVLSETPKCIEGIGILLRTRVKDNKTMIIYYPKNDKIEEYDMSKFYYSTANTRGICTNKVTTYICIEPERSGFDIEVVNEQLKNLKFYDKFIPTVKAYSKTFNKFYVNVVKGIVCNVLNPAEMKHLLSICPDTHILKFRSYSVPDYRLVSVNYDWERVEEITNNLKRSPVYIPKNNVKRNINKKDSQQMTTYINKPVIVVNKKQVRPNGRPKIEGIGILVRRMMDCNKFTIYYVDSKTVRDYSYDDYYDCTCTPSLISKLSISTYICLDKTDRLFNMNTFSPALSQFDSTTPFKESELKLEYDLTMFGKMYLRIVEGIFVDTFTPEQMEEIISRSPKTTILQFLSYNYFNPAYQLASINYNSNDIDDIIKTLKTGLILDSYDLYVTDGLDKDTCKINYLPEPTPPSYEHEPLFVAANKNNNVVGFYNVSNVPDNRYDYSWMIPSRCSGKQQWFNAFVNHPKPLQLSSTGDIQSSMNIIKQKIIDSFGLHKDDLVTSDFATITATEIEQQRTLKRLHQEYMKLQEVRKMLYKLDFTTTKGKRYASYGKHNGEEIPTITTIVNFGGITGKATVDEKDYDERQGILEALGNAIYGSFETEYQKYKKKEAQKDKKLRICTICGKLHNTQDEARNCEKAHKERKESEKAKWTIRKEAIRRLKEQTYEDSVQSEMNKLKNKSKDEDKTKDTTTKKSTKSKSTKSKSNK